MDYEAIKNIIGGGLLSIAGLMTIIQVTPIKLDPWSALAEWIGKALNKDVTKKIDEQKDAMEAIRAKTDSLAEQLEQKDAEDARNHILRFGDEIKNHIRHSEEYFNQILDDITKYERYCELHPDFKNARTVVTKNIILEVYQKCVREKDFL